MSRRTEMLLKNMEFVGYNDLNKKPGFQMGMHRTEDGRYFIYSACFRDNGFNIIEVTDPKNPVSKWVEGDWVSEIPRNTRAAILGRFQDLRHHRGSMESEVPGSVRV